MFLDGLSEVKIKKKKKPLPDTAPRRSARNAGEVAEEVLLDEKRKKGRRASDEAVEEEEAGEKNEEGLTPEEAQQVQEALELKHTFKTPKKDLNNILDILEKYASLRLLNHLFLSCLPMHNREDSQKIFLSPVEDLIPDYTNVIEHSMCFETMRKKVSSGKYVKWDKFWV